MLDSGIKYAGPFGFVGAALLLVGFPLYEISEWMARRQPARTSAVLTGTPSVNHQPSSEAIQPDVQSFTRRDTP
jgi:hypothetical protein